MNIESFIREKRDGQNHSKSSLEAWAESVASGKAESAQVGAWLMAVFLRGMNDTEIADLTEAMWKSGKSIPRSEASRSEFWVDKHSTGGVGDKTSLLLVPWVAATCERLLGAGRVKIPMISGRGLGRTGGTLDKLESVPGFQVRQDLSACLELLEQNDHFIVGQTQELSPVDRVLYAARDITGTVECVPLIVSSILSKKLSASLDGLVMDVKYGSGAAMKDRQSAELLASKLAFTGEKLGLPVRSILSETDFPLGFSVGHSLEILECLEFAEGGRRHPQLEALTLDLAESMIVLASRGSVSPDLAREELDLELKSGGVARRMRRMLNAQGGDVETFLDRWKDGLTSHEIQASEPGHWEGLSADTTAETLLKLGGSRLLQSDRIDFGVGVECLLVPGEVVKAGTPTVRVWCREPSQPQQLEELLAELARAQRIRVLPLASRPGQPSELGLSR